MMVPNFPNFFLLLGPNTILAHNSATFMIECQVSYIENCLKEVIKSGNWKSFQNTVILIDLKS
jgi:hypothetical protein